MEESIEESFAKLLNKLDDKAREVMTEPTVHLSNIKKVAKSKEFSDVNEFFFDNMITPKGNINYAIINAAEDKKLFKTAVGESDLSGPLSFVIITDLGRYVLV